MHLTERQRNGLKWLLETRRTLALSLPIMTGMVGHMLMGLTDTLMVGHVGVIPLAASALVNTVSHVPVVCALGLLAAVQILTSQAYGARMREEAGEVIRHGLFIAAVTSLFMAPILILAGPKLVLLGQPKAVVLAGQGYLGFIAWSILPALLSHAGKQFSEALNNAWVPMAIVLGGVLLNVGLNWILIFGHLGAPAMGLDGAGLATLISRIVVAAGMLVYLLRSPATRGWLPIRWLKSIDRIHLGEQLRIGGPVGLQHLMEVGAISVAALMLGWISAAAIAAHQIAITCAATTFMFALGVGMGVSIRVGHAWGAGLSSRIKRIALGGVAMGAGTMGVFAIVFTLAGATISGWFVQDVTVIGLATSLLFVAGIFQVCDGVQVVMISALRGMSDVRMPLLIVVFAYWGVALPTAYVLAFVAGFGAVGIWIGLAVGLGTAALGLSLRFWSRVRETRSHAVLRRPAVVAQPAT